MTLAEGFRSLDDRIFRHERAPIVLALSVILFGTRLHGSMATWPWGAAIILLSGLVFRFPRHRRVGLIGITICMAQVVLSEWHFIDNHKYLITYWALTCALCTGRERQDALLSSNARLLIGLTFAFSTLWKFIPLEIFDGTLFESLFLLDPRFHPFTMFVGGVPEAALQRNQELFFNMTLFPGDDTWVQLQSTALLQAVAVATAGWIVGIEGALALSFLLPLRPAFARVRDYLLLVFMLTTYVVAPVDRFALVLCVMGFAQCATDRPVVRRLYLYGFPVLHLLGAVRYSFPALARAVW